MTDAAVSVRGLTKSYAGTPAVRGIDLQINQGEIFALLGPNGAGKTTTVEILEGYRSRDGGEVSVLGFDPARRDRRMKARIGIVLQQTGVERYLTVRETLEMYAGFYPHPLAVDEVIGLVGLTEKRDARVLKLSGGQQRRLDVAVALVGDPDLMFLDEPTTGFDPSARHEAWAVVKDLAALGKTVLLTTHYMDEAQQLADRVAVIADGRIVAEGSPATLGRRDVAAVRIRFRLPAGAPDLPADLAELADLADLGDLATHPAPAGRLEIATADPVRIVHRLTGWALDNAVELEALEVSRPSLEDVYLELTS